MQALIIAVYYCVAVRTPFYLRPVSVFWLLFFPFQILKLSFSELTREKSLDISFLFLPCEPHAIPTSHDWYSVCCRIVKRSRYTIVSYVNIIEFPTAKFFHFSNNFKPRPTPLGALVLNNWLLCLYVRSRCHLWCQQK